MLGDHPPERVGQPVLRAECADRGCVHRRILSQPKSAGITKGMLLGDGESVTITGTESHTLPNIAAGLRTLGAQVEDASKIDWIEASSMALNSSSDCPAESPSVSAREKLAIMPRF